MYFFGAVGAKGLYGHWNYSPWLALSPGLLLDSASAHRLQPCNTQVPASFL